MWMRPVGTVFAYTMKRILSLLGVSLLLGLLFLKLNANYSESFTEVEERGRGKNPTSVNLVKGCDTARIASVLSVQKYLPTREDAVFAARCMSAVLEKGETLNTLYDLNKRVWMPSAAMIDSLGSGYYRERLHDSRVGLGQDSLFHANKGKELPSTVTDSSAYSGKITVVVRSRESKEPVPGVVVRLSQQYLDSLNGYSPERRTMHFLKTDNEGKAHFCGLDTACSYSVLPIREFYEYGMSRGTIGGSLGQCTGDGVLEVGFTEQEHRIRLFSNSMLKNIKEDLSLTVRTPDEFTSSLVKFVALFFIAWWGAFLIFHILGKKPDTGIFAALMLLSGLCLLTMFSVNNPLTDKLLGKDMAYGVLFGVVIVVLLSRVDFIKFYQGQYRIGFDIPAEILKWLFKPFRRKVRYLTGTLTDRGAGWFRKLLSLLLILVVLVLFIWLDLLQITRLGNAVENGVDRLPKGTGYLAMALFLTMLLFTPLGAEVGGMKVNLNVGFLFQPSEIAKYLIIIFMAAFFCSNANRIVLYSAKGNASLFMQKLKMMFGILGGLAALVLLYMYLGDMGPAMVLTFTFIILYSIIKSKVELGGLSNGRQLLRILSCDVAMLIYGVVSFIAFLYFGNMFGMMGMACVAWFVLWILIGLLSRQIHETAIFFNLVVAAFIFGGGIMRSIGADSVADRLESRNEMCTNTWGVLPIDGAEADAGENTQVAEGLWGIATGGITGQGLGKGAPHVIPAFHTDMVLESIGEQMGFIGITAVVLLLAFLMLRTLTAGYRASHPFAFFLCLGIAIVTGVQFVIIALGSTGVIPLTGVTVPFLSYGKVSMILNIAAFGMILSISGHSSQSGNDESDAAMLQQKNIESYGYPMSILCWFYCMLATLVLAVFFNYQYLDRDNTLLRPVYVNNDNGAPVVQYNPRIGKVVERVKPGDIYDRNGVLLATCDVDKLTGYSEVYEQLGLDSTVMADKERYYPFGDHLFFMLGDINRGYTYAGRGYMAEGRHMSYLRGISDKDGNGRSKNMVTLESRNYRPDRFSASGSVNFEQNVVLHDYSQWLPYLKSGSDGKELKEAMANRYTPQDLYLTIDARLQTMLQQRLQEYKENNPTRKSRGKKIPIKWNKIRVSVVVIDARKGDLLASANYPMLDYDRMLDGGNYYSDNRTDDNWKSYLDMDLGLMYATEPGSTAKVMTSLAALRKPGVTLDQITDTVYNVNAAEAIYKSEVSQRSNYNLKEALRYSSNCYFINLVNDFDLYKELAYVYGHTGVSIYNKSPYGGLGYSEPDENWNSEVLKGTKGFVSRYRWYDKRRKDKKNGDSRWIKMNSGTFPSQWSWAWGQRDIKATPLAMARVASVAANGGYMTKTRFLLGDSIERIRIVDEHRADILNDYMKYTSRGHDNFKRTDIGGKTGTPEREIQNLAGKIVKANDGWYICFFEDATVGRVENGEHVYEKSSIAVALRMERTFDGTSSMATELMKQVVEKTLEELGYIMTR